jgi:hypothetical protein
MTLGGYGMADLHRGFVSHHEREIYLDRVLTNRYCLERRADLDLGLDYGWPETIPFEDLADRIRFVLVNLDWYEIKYFEMPIIS